jgi:hypothetical protein
MHPPSAPTSHAFAEWFRRVVCVFTHILSMCVFLPSVRITGETGGTQQLQSMFVQVRGMIEDPMVTQHACSGTETRASPESNSLSRTIHELDQRWFMSWINSHLFMLQTYVEWCVANQQKVHRDVCAIQTAVSQWDEKIRSMVNGHRAQLRSDVSRLLDKWVLFCDHYYQRTEQQTSYEDIYADIERTMPVHIDLLALMDRFVQNWCASSNVPMEHDDVNILTLISALRGLTHEMATYQMTDGVTPLADMWPELETLTTKKKRVIAQLRTAVQQITLDNRPQRKWLNTGYMFLPLMLDIETRLFNVYSATYWMHRCVHTIKQEVISRILRTTTDAMRTFLSKQHALIDDKLRPFYHNRSMLLERVPLQERDRYTSGFRVCPTQKTTHHTLSQLHGILGHVRMTTLVHHAKHGL